MLDVLSYRIMQPAPSLLKGKRFRFIDNGADVLAVAHCDYVERGGPLTIDSDGYIISSRLDDRLGVFAILDLLPRMGITTDILLTDDEERCSSTAALFAPGKNYRYCFSFDRAGDDAVFYDHYPELKNAVANDWAIGIGSYSDIAELRIPGFNAGIGYYDQHTSDCYCHLEEVYQLVERYKLFHEAHEGVRFDECNDYSEVTEYDRCADYSDDDVCYRW